MKHTNLLFPCLSKTGGVNRRPLDVTGVEVLVDEVANLEPAGLHRMVADWAGLSKNALCLRTRAHRPGFAGFGDTARVAGQAIEVGESPRVDKQGLNIINTSVRFPRIVCRRRISNRSSSSTNPRDWRLF